MLVNSIEKSIVILGPTASGKSSLAVKLAKRFNGEIISVDSRQVYKGINLASGKITKKEMQGIKHYCLDLATTHTYFTVDHFKKFAEKAFAKIRKKNKIPFLVGGSAFYIKALTDPLSIPHVPPDWKLRKNLTGKSTKELFSILKKIDPRRAKEIDRHNPRRLIRAIEIVKSTGKPIPKRELGIRNYESRKEILFLGVKIDKDVLKKRIAKRLTERFKKGMMKEIKKLHRPRAGGGVSWGRLESLGLEPRWIARFLQKKIPEKEMRGKLLADIVYFTKKQMTWWKKEKRIHWIRSEKEAEYIIKKFLANA